MSFLSAENYCQSFGSHLPSIHDSVENLELRKMLEGTFWIGLIDIQFEVTLA
jgi:hypothetical protein